MPEDLDPPYWSFDIQTCDHDDIKVSGYTKARWSRVTINRLEEPVWERAMADAACMAVAIHGGMPTKVLPRY